MENYDSVYSETSKKVGMFIELGILIGGPIVLLVGAIIGTFF